MKWLLALSLCVALGYSQRDAEATARHTLDLLLAGKYTELQPLLTPLGRERLTPDFLRDKVGVEIRSFGKLSSIGKPVRAVEGKNTLVSFPCQFTATTVNIQLTVNESQQIAGLYLRPPNAPLPPVRQQPAYVKRGAFTEREISLGADPWKLGGTLTTPTGNGPFSALVLVHGPGPNDRDETLYSNRIFKDLAEGLASQGIAVLRYDKRTKVYGDRMSDLDYTVEQETVADAALALAFLRTQPGIDPRRVSLLGHSFGGYLAPRIAARDAKVAGIILLAANARPIEDVTLDQFTYVARLAGGPTPEAQKRLDALKAEVIKVKALSPGKSNPPVVMGLRSAYLLDLKTYDAPAAAKRLAIPILVLQGERDFQVNMSNLTLWKQSLGNTATYKTYPALNHLFIAAEQKSTPAEYRVPGNVAAEVITDIATWLKPTK